MPKGGKDEPQDESQRVELSTGVVLRVRPVPPYLVRRRTATLPRPAPPKIFLEDKGIEEENPDHPQYRRDLEDWEDRTRELGQEVLFVAGTEVEFVPEGLFRPEEDGWLELLQHFDIEVNLATPRDRYYSWLQSHAIGSAWDITKLYLALRKVSGISEEEVQEAISGFRSPEGRGASNELPVANS